MNVPAAWSGRAVVLGQPMRDPDGGLVDLRLEWASAGAREVVASEDGARLTELVGPLSPELAAALEGVIAAGLPAELDIAGDRSRYRIVALPGPDGQVAVSLLAVEVAPLAEPGGIITRRIVEQRLRAASDEQAALRRVATEIAREGARGVLTLLCREVADLFGGACAVVEVSPGARVLATHPRALSTAQAREALHALVEECAPAGERGPWTVALSDLGREVRADIGPLLALGHRSAALAAPDAAVTVVALGDPVLPSLGVEGALAAFADLVALARTVAQAHEELAALARTDDLTGLANRRAFVERLEEEVHRALRLGAPLALVMIDLDHFKAVNDTHGHAVGDRVLVELAERLRHLGREGELVARIGGEEFAWLLPGTDAAGAAVAAERARAATATAPLGDAGALTLSAGVSELAGDVGTADALLRTADGALYAAKAAGRNRVERYRG